MVVARNRGYSQSPKLFVRQKRKTPRRRDGGLPNFIRNDIEAYKHARPEDRRKRDIRGVAPTRHQDPADARRVVAGIEGVPMATEIDFEPGAEIHRRIDRRNTDIAEISRAVPGGDVHAAAERDREMGEIPAHPPALIMAG